MALAFDDLQLNPKLLQALRKKGFATPTHVQATCIPEALLGKDLVAQARTGTGKTLAYVLPALHRILAGAHGPAGWQALVLVPTRELCEQASLVNRLPRLKHAAGSRHCCSKHTEQLVRIHACIHASIMTACSHDYTPCWSTVCTTNPESVHTNRWLMSHMLFQCTENTRLL